MEIPKLVKEVVLQFDKNAEVILFGSRARGDHQASSDWDFLILMEVGLDKGMKDQILERLYELELKSDAVISCILHTKSDWENRAVTPIFKIISKEGIAA